MNYSVEIFKKNIVYLRGKTSNKQFAEQLGISARTIPNLTGGKVSNYPRVDTLIELANRLGRTIDELLSVDLEEYDTANIKLDEIATSKFSKKKFNLYFIRDASTPKISQGYAKFDNPTVPSSILSGEIKLAKKYNCKLSVGAEGTAYIDGRSTAKGENRRVHIAVFLPDFDSDDAVHYGGMGLMIFLDRTKILVAQRIALCAEEINLEDNEQTLLDFLTRAPTEDEGKVSGRVILNRAYDSRYVEWLKSLSGNN